MSVCLSVCYHASEGITRFYAEKEIRTVLLWAFLGFNLVNFQKNSVQKLYREKANMLMSVCLTRPPMALIQ